MIAAIQTGGKQYLVSPGQKVRIEKIEGKEGDNVVFDKVLLTNDGLKTEIGMPLLEGAKVSGKIVSQGRGEKVLVLKFKNKVRYHRKKGHKQAYTEVEITNIK